VGLFVLLRRYVAARRSGRAAAGRLTLGSAARSTTRMQLRAALGFLLDGYDERRGLVFWETVVLMRKACYSAVQILLRDRVIQTLGGVLVAGGAMLLQQRFSPYTDARLNRFEAICAVATFITAILSAALLARLELREGVAAGTPAAIAVRIATSDAPETDPTLADQGIALAMIALNGAVAAVLLVELGRSALATSSVVNRTTRRARAALSKSLEAAGNSLASAASAATGALAAVGDKAARRAESSGLPLLPDGTVAGRAARGTVFSLLSGGSASALLAEKRAVAAAAAAGGAAPAAASSSLCNIAGAGAAAGVEGLGDAPLPGAVNAGCSASATGAADVTELPPQRAKRSRVVIALPEDGLGGGGSDGSMSVLASQRQQLQQRDGGSDEETAGQTSRVVLRRESGSGGGGSARVLNPMMATIALRAAGRRGQGQRGSGTADAGGQRGIAAFTPVKARPAPRAAAAAAANLAQRSGFVNKRSRGEILRRQTLANKSSLRGLTGTAASRSRRRLSTVDSEADLGDAGAAGTAGGAVSEGASELGRSGTGGIGIASGSGSDSDSNSLSDWEAPPDVVLSRAGAAAVVPGLALAGAAVAALAFRRASQDQLMFPAVAVPRSRAGSTASSGGMPSARSSRAGSTASSTGLPSIRCSRADSLAGLPPAGLYGGDDVGRSRASSTSVRSSGLNSLSLHRSQPRSADHSAPGSRRSSGQASSGSGGSVTAAKAAAAAAVAGLLAAEHAEREAEAAAVARRISLAHNARQSALAAAAAAAVAAGALDSLQAELLSASTAGGSGHRASQALWRLREQEALAAAAAADPDDKWEEDEGQDEEEEQEQEEEDGGSCGSAGSSGVCEDPAGAPEALQPCLRDASGADGTSLPGGTSFAKGRRAGASRDSAWSVGTGAFAATTDSPATPSAASSASAASVASVAAAAAATQAGLSVSAVGIEAAFTGGAGLMTARASLQGPRAAIPADFFAAPSGSLGAVASYRAATAAGASAASSAASYTAPQAASGFGDMRAETAGDGVGVTTGAPVGGAPGDARARPVHFFPSVTPSAGDSVSFFEEPSASDAPLMPPADVA
jgi:hypothetical protein